MIPNPIADPNQPTVPISNRPYAQQQFGNPNAGYQPQQFAYSAQPYGAPQRQPWHIILGLLAIALGAYMLFQSGWLGSHLPTTTSQPAPIHGNAPVSNPATNPGTNPAPNTATLSGTWVGVGQAATSSGTHNFGVLLDVQQNGAQISGTADVCFSATQVTEAQLTGTVNGSSLNMTWATSSATVQLNAQVANGDITFQAQSSGENDQGQLAPGSQSDFTNVCQQLGG